MSRSEIALLGTLTTAAGLITTGVALIDVPAAIIAAGVLLAVLAFLALYEVRA
jgi:hypothetical protein